MDWRGRHVVVTGGSSGIGRAVALAAVRRGASLTLVARSPERLEEAAARLRDVMPDSAVGAVSVDVSDREAVADAFAASVVERGARGTFWCVLPA